MCKNLNLKRGDVVPKLQFLERLPYKNTFSQAENRGNARACNKITVFGTSLCFFFLLIFICISFFTGCSRQRTLSLPFSERIAAARVEDILKRIMPLQMEDGIVKVAVIRNLTNTDHTRLFVSGCITEGITLGFHVDIFITEGDDKLCKEYIYNAIEEDYDGIILSHGGAFIYDEYTYDILHKAIQRGKKVVTFDSLPYKDGDINSEILEGVTSTSQEDFRLAEISLDSLVNYFPESMHPIRVIRTWMGPGFSPINNRKAVFDRYVEEGKITEIAFIAPYDHSDPRGGTRTALSELLPNIGTGSVDAIWGCYDELAKGSLDALLEAGRKDMVIMSIDISDNDIRYMLTSPDIWISTAAVDPKLIGITNMRLLAMKFADVPTPDTYYFKAHLIETALLDNSVNMTNLSKVIDGWGSEEGLFDYFDWMEELRAITYRY